MEAVIETPNGMRADVWSCGGGRQSVAIAVLIIQGRLPKPDVSVIVDTGYEKQSTWDYYESFLKPGLNSAGVIITKISGQEWTAKWGKGFFSTNGGILLPGFTNQSGENAKLPGFCSKAWKQSAVHRWLSQRHELTEAHRRTWLGFSLDEPRRYASHLESESVRLPLVLGVPMRSNDCVSLVKKHGWPEPPRSACYMCPNLGDDEWREIMINRPEEFWKAVQIERQIRKRDPFFFLHKQCVPLDQVDWDKTKGAGTSCASGDCFL